MAPAGTRVLAGADVRPSRDGAATVASRSTERKWIAYGLTSRPLPSLSFARRQQGRMDPANRLLPTVGDHLYPVAFSLDLGHLRGKCHPRDDAGVRRRFLPDIRYVRFHVQDFVLGNGRRLGLECGFYGIQYRRQRRRETSPRTMEAAVAHIQGRPNSRFTPAVFSSVRFGSCWTFAVSGT